MKPIAEQTILITGATDGLGKATALALASQGARLLLHGRSAERLQLTRQELTAASGNDHIETYRADFASLAEVRALAQNIQSQHSRLDMLINNAAAPGSKPEAHQRELSTDDHELSFAVNYLAPFLLTHLLLPSLRAAAPSRIINVSSIGQKPINFDDIMMEHNYVPLDAYRQSKLAQVMFTFDLAEKLRDQHITVNVLHPASLMPTKLAQEYFGWTIETLQDGVNSLLHVAADPALDSVTGIFFDHQQLARANEQAYDAAVRQRLWDLSCRLCGLDSALP